MALADGKMRSLDAGATTGGHNRRFAQGIIYRQNVAHLVSITALTRSREPINGIPSSVPIWFRVVV
jgi:hypothetical protein